MTPKYYYIVIDTLGHRDFNKNLITGISQASQIIGIDIDSNKFAIAKNFGVIEFVNPKRF